MMRVEFQWRKNIYVQTSPTCIILAIHSKIKESLWYKISISLHISNPKQQREIKLKIEEVKLNMHHDATWMIINFNATATVPPFIHKKNLIKPPLFLTKSSMRVVVRILKINMLHCSILLQSMTQMSWIMYN